MSRINGFIGRRGLLKLAGFSGIAIAANAVSGVPWYTKSVSLRLHKTLSLLILIQH